MNNYKRDKFLTEAMLNCDHDYEDVPRPYGYGDFDTIKVCSVCDHREDYTIDFSTPNGFFKLWKWCKDQRWYCDLVKSFDVLDWDFKWLDPDNLADRVYEMLKEQ